MKHFALIAGLMFIAAQAYAAPHHRPDHRYAHRDDVYHFQRGGILQVAEHGRDNHRSADHDRDSHREADRGHGGRSDWHGDREDGDHRKGGDRYWDNRRSPAFYRPPFGRMERSLPDRYMILRVRNHPYYYYGGIFYDYFNGSYVVINAPFGATVPYLPAGYISFLIGPTRYFYFGGTYYINSGQQYEVVEPPPEAHKIVNTADEKMIIYPAKGQSQDQLNKDRYQCHRWAVGQTGFDPSANNPDLSLKPDYIRAMSACLQARGYVVK